MVNECGQKSNKSNKSNKRFDTVGLVVRFKPLHNGGTLMLDYVCSQSEHVKIGIGSSNRYDLRNPFTADESEAMVHAYLRPRYSNYEVLHIPDFGHLGLEYRDGSAWRQCVLQKFGSLDAFITGNEYVRDLLSNDYTIIHPGFLIPREKYVFLHATDVRVAMAKNEDWKSLVPMEVAGYLEKNHLIERFIREFGSETILYASNSVKNTVTLSTDSAGNNGSAVVSKIGKSLAEIEQKHTWGE